MAVTPHSLAKAMISKLGYKTKPKQRARKAKYSKAPLAQKVKSIIRQSQETKCAVSAPFNSTSGSLNTFISFTQAITGTNETYALIPPITQGIDDHQRIGDEISPVSLTVRGVVAIDPTIKPSVTIVADVYFLTSKAVKSELVYGGVPITSLFKDAGGGLSSYDGSVRNTLLPFNSDDFTLIKHKRFVFGKPADLTNGSVGTGSSSVAMADGYARPFTVKIPLPTTLKYATAGNTVPQNAYPFMVCGWHFGDAYGNVVGSQQSISVNAISTLYYKDA